MSTLKFDVAILGSGFSGSLLAWILASKGRKVVLLDRQSHPRFAIGESSTPLADFLLEQIANEFHLGELLPLSRWGSWQATYPNLRCGKKRGFSYFYHYLDKHFAEDTRQHNSWLVAASECDRVSDTHWHRADVDQWLCERAVESGCHFLCPWELKTVARDTQSKYPWKLTATNGTHPEQSVASSPIQCRYLVDASGGGGVIGNSLRIQSQSESLQVRTRAIFGHFRGVGSMSDWVATHTSSDCNSPFDADDAAQHHILQHGWFWMLRFAEGTTSVGLVMPGNNAIKEPDKIWQQTLSTYPTLNALMSTAVPVPTGTRSNLRAVSRISRLWAQCSGDDWLMLPGTAGVVDPLHSTGIAHGLYGVQKAARLLLTNTTAADRSAGVRQLGEETIREVQWIDRIVSLAYRAMQIDKRLFEAACCLYFLSAIHCEREMATNGRMEAGFLRCRDQAFSALIAWFEKRLMEFESARRRNDLRPSKQETPNTRNMVDNILCEFEKQISPWNDIGLLGSRRVARSSAPK